MFRLAALFALAFTFSQIGASQTPEELFARELTGEITAALEAGDSDEVLALTNAYKELGILVPGTIHIAEAQAHLIGNNLHAAQKAYELALTDSGLSTVERVRAKELLRKITGTLDAEREREEALRAQSQRLLAFALDQPDRLIEESSAEELTDLIEGLGPTQRKELWKVLNRVGWSENSRFYSPNLSSAPDLSIYKYARSTGNFRYHRSSRLQQKLICVEDFATLARFADLVLADDKSRLNTWFRYPAFLPNECWSNYSQLLRHLEIDPSQPIHDSNLPSLMQYEFGGTYIEKVLGRVEIGTSPAAFMFFDVLTEWGYRPPAGRVDFQLRDCDTFTGACVTSSYVYIEQDSLPLQLLAKAMGPHPNLFQADTPSYQEIIEDYRSLIRVQERLYPGVLSRIKFAGCHKWNTRLSMNVLFWRAAQLEGASVADQLPQGCYLGSFKYPTRKYKGRSISRVIATDASMPKYAALMAAGNSEEYNSIVADLLIDAQVDLSVSWYSPIRFPLLYAAQTGQCGVYQKLKAAGAKDFGGQARRTIRKLDKTCK